MCGRPTRSDVAVCAVVPASAQVTEVQLFTRRTTRSRTGAKAAWKRVRTRARRRFLDAPFERAHTDASKEVCFNFAHWGADKGRAAQDRGADT